MRQFNMSIRWGARPAKATLVGLILLSPILIGSVTQLSAEEDGVAATFTTFNVDSFAEGSDSNPGNGTCSTSGGDCTLRAAIEEANALEGSDTINVPAGTYLLNDQLVILDDVNIFGDGIDATFIDGQDTTEIIKVQTHELLVCDNGDESVIGYDVHGNPNGSFVSPGSNGLDDPIAIDINSSGDVYITTFTDGVFQYDSDSSFEEVFITPATLGANTLLVDGVFQSGPNFDFYVADFFPNNRVMRFDRFSGAKVDTLTSAQMSQPNSIAFYDDNVYVTDAGANKVLKYNGDNGNFIETFIDTFPAGLDRPRGLVFKDDVLYVANEGNDSVKRFNASTGASLGTFVASQSGGLDKPSDITFGPDGNFYVLSGQTDEVLRYDGSTGAFIDVFVEEDDVYLDHPSCIEWRSSAGVGGPSVRIEALTIQNGASSGIGADTSGLKVTHGASVTLSHVAVKDNRSSIFGGGIQNWGTLYMFDSDVIGNSLPTSTGGGQTSQGGGIFNSGYLILGRVLISDNTSIRGAGISNTNNGIVEITDTTISGNDAFGAGGGIRNVANGIVRINHSTVVQNTTTALQFGGEANRFGGGIYTDNPAKTFIANSIVAENDDNRSRFSADFSPDCYNDTAGHFASFGDNLIGIISDNCTFDDEPSDMNGDGESPLDPELGNLINRVHMPLNGSPVVDAGDTSSTSGGIPGLFFPYSCRFTDQNGISRPLDGDGNGNAACDLGAAELFNESFSLNIGVGIPIFDNGTIDFGTLEIGETAEKTVTINNSGNISLFVESESIPPGFALTTLGNGKTIRPGQSFDVVIEFSSIQAGDYEGWMTLMIGSKLIDIWLDGTINAIDTPTHTPTSIHTPTHTATPTPTSDGSPSPTSTSTAIPSGSETPIPTMTGTPAPNSSETPNPPQVDDELIYLPMIRY